MEVHGMSGESYNIIKQIRFKTSLRRSDICDSSDAYIRNYWANDRNKHNRQLILENNAPFISSTSKISGTFMKNADDLMLQCLCTIWWNTAKIIQRHQVLYGIITKILQLIL